MTFCGCFSIGTGVGGSSVRVSVVEWVRVTTTGVGVGVPGRKVIGVGMPFGSRVGNGVGVYVDVGVGVGGRGVGEAVGVAVGVVVGVRVGVWVEVAVAVGSGVRLGVELGAAACREVSGVGGTDVPLDLRQPGAVTWKEQFPTTSDSRTATNATPPNQRFLDLFT
jgi:hypothetical protein